jgi:hypothetical protein
VKSTKRNMILGYAAGGVLFVGGTALGIFGPASESSASGAPTCESKLASDVTSCDGRIYAKNGEDYTWTIAKPAEYTLTLRQPKVKYPIDGTLTIKDQTGAQVAYNDGGSPGADAKIKQRFEAGTYTINVRDFAKSTVKGGYSFHLEIAKTEEPAVSSASITSATLPVDSAPPAAKAAPAKATGTGSAKGHGAKPAPAPKASGKH